MFNSRVTWSTLQIYLDNLDKVSNTNRPSEGEVKLQSDGLGEGECVLAEGLTRYVAEAAWADGCDVGLVLLEAEPEGGGAGRRARRMLRVTAPAAPAAASPVHQRAPVVRQREDLHLEEPATGCRLQSIVSLALHSPGTL